MNKLPAVSHGGIEALSEIQTPHTPQVSKTPDPPHEETMDIDDPFITEVITSFFHIRPDMKAQLRNSPAPAFKTALSAQTNSESQATPEALDRANLPITEVQPRKPFPGLVEAGFAPEARIMVRRANRRLTARGEEAMLRRMIMELVP